MAEIINLIITVVMIVVCYNLAKKNNMSAAFALLGLFGIVGAVALILIIKFSGNNSNLKDGNNTYSDYNGNNYNNTNGGYNGNNYNANNSYNDGGYASQNGGNSAPADDKFKKCPKCGAKIEKYASFCTYCGKEL
ncbi:MAG: zinc ribbon domain-containing protein [Lachnospiraceae bacterium]|nr:zinc ribbon domain-containing protein [Lachnospiraceae bacterium]